MEVEETPIPNDVKLMLEEVVEPKTSKEGLPKRGRKKKHNITSSDVADMIFGVHQLIAMFAKDEKLMITKDGAEMIATPALAVVAQYNLWWIFESSNIINLAVAVSIVEGPIVLYLINKAKEKRREGESGEQA